MRPSSAKAKTLVRCPCTNPPTASTSFCKPMPTDGEIVLRAPKGNEDRTQNDSSNGQSLRRTTTNPALDAGSRLP